MSGPAWLSLAPLALACAALGVREATREPRHAADREFASREQLPSPLALLAARAPDGEQLFSIDGPASRAQAGVPARMQALVASGTLETLARDEGLRLSVVLAPEAQGRRTVALDRISLHASSQVVRRARIPGLSIVELRGRCTTPGDGRDVRFEGVWMRTPAGGRLHGVVEIDGWGWGQGEAGDEPADGVRRIGLDLRVKPEGAGR